MIRPFAIVLLGSLLAAAEIPVVPEHQPFRTTVTITNPYDRAIRLAEEDASCTCSELELGTRFLLPFASTTLTFETPNRNESGVQAHRVWLIPANPRFVPLLQEFTWEVRPDIAVDLVQRGATDQRPEDPLYHNIYAGTVWVKPAEAAERLALSGADSKRFRLWSPPASRPGIDALRIERIAYEGDLLDFKHRNLDDDTILLAVVGKEGIGEIAPGSYSERFVLHTNHPHKPTIEMDLHVALDPRAGDLGAADPWASLR